MNSGRTVRRNAVLLAALAVLVTAALPAQRREPLNSHPFFAPPAEGDVLVIAHQGGNHLWPDNTLVAFRGAAAMGVDVLELDIASTSDGVLVVIHDLTVDRTTNGSGPVNSFTLAELRELDAAYHWPHHVPEDERTYPYRGQGVVIPTLEEVFLEFPDIRINVEIKQADPPIVEKLAELIDEYDRWDSTLVASFDAETMYAFRERWPHAATSTVEPEVRRFFTLNLLFLGRFYRSPAAAFQVPNRFGNLHVIRPRFARIANRRGVDVHGWTPNTEEAIQEMIDDGVQGIITDRPDIAMRLLGRDPGPVPQAP